MKTRKERRFYVLIAPVLITLMLGVIGCGNANLAERIQTLEQQQQEKTSVANNIATDEVKKVTNDLINVYEEFAKANPKDSNTPNYLFKAADFSRYYMHDYDKAAGLYQQIHSNHTEHKRGADALFNLAFMYNNELKSQDKAKELYEQFLNVYPKHSLAFDAEFELKNLGKTDAEILEELRQKNSQENDSTTTKAGSS